MMNPENFLILVIDDQNNNLKVLQGMLELVGYRLTFAKSGRQAIERVATASPNLILLDLMMPDMDGMQLCEILKHNPDSANIPIIFLTASHEKDHLLKAFETGAVDYIKKPFNKPELLARIKTHLELNYLREQAVKQAEQERIISSITHSIHYSLDLNNTLAIATHKLQQLLSADQVIIAECKTVTTCKTIAQVCHPDIAVKLDPVILNADFSLVNDLSLCSIQNWSIEHPQSANLSTDYQTWLETHHIKAELRVPIFQENQLWGVLLMRRYQELKTWTSQEVETVARIVDQLAIAIQHSQLHHQLKAANQQLQYLAHTDSLTQLANRRLFKQCLDQEWKRLKREKLPLSLILSDIDYFKKYNDFYGHPQGDNCLKQVAQAINNVVKRPADLVSRYGGEEFIILLPNTNLEGAIQVAENIQKAIAHLKIPHVCSEIIQSITLSLGVSTVIPSGDLTPSQFIKIADQALYDAKRNGRNQYAVRTEKRT